jgi:DNA repair protein RecO
MVFEGVVISKVPYKERDLIVKLLLRSGFMASFYVYGGQGGGKHHKPTLFELGSMMKIMIKDKRIKSPDSELLVVAEYQRTWEPQVIRHDIKAFYLSCLFFEIVQKFAVQYHSAHDESSGEHEGIFSVISNALFYLDEAVLKKKFLPEQQLNLFMVKLLFHLGIMPDTDHCGYCGKDLLSEGGSTFLIAQGHFSCLACVTAENERGLLLRIKKGYQTKYQDYESLTGATFQEADKLIQYFCHHFQLKTVDLRSYSLLFK